MLVPTRLDAFTRLPGKGLDGIARLDVSTQIPCIYDLAMIPLSQGYYSQQIKNRLAHNVDGHRDPGVL